MQVKLNTTNLETHNVRFHSKHNELSNKKSESTYAKPITTNPQRLTQVDDNGRDYKTLYLMALDVIAYQNQHKKLSATPINQNVEK